MKYLIILLLIVSCKSESQNANGDTNYYLIRHAEKDRSNPKESNPNLSAKGQERAQEWVGILKDKGISKIYSTDYNRTQQTAQPLAEALSLKVQSYDPTNMYTAEFVKETKGYNVLIVGHSNTTPMFVNKIIANSFYTDLDDDNNGALCKVTVKPNGETAVQLAQYEEGFK